MRENTGNRTVRSRQFIIAAAKSYKAAAAICGALVLAVSVTPAVSYGKSSDKTVAIIQGPIESIDKEKSLVCIAGQVIPLDKISNVRIGHLAVLLQIDDGKSQRLLLVDAYDTYVPGAMRVLVSGRVDEVDASLARIRIEGLWIDYSALLASAPQLKFSNGEIVSLSGIQPSSGGVLIADVGRVQINNRN